MEFIPWLVIGICIIAALCGIMSMFIVKDKHKPLDLDVEIEDTDDEENDD